MIGSGPAGLSAAAQLNAARLNQTNVTALDDLARHTWHAAQAQCAHPGEHATYPRALRTSFDAAFANLNHSQLKAIYQAGEKAGLFA